MSQHPFKQIPFVIGASICGLFALLAILGYALSTDDSPNANQIMPEWASLKPGSRVEYLEGPSSSSKPWYAFLSGWSGRGELISVEAGSLRQQGADWDFISGKTGQAERRPCRDFQRKTRRFWLGSDTFGRDILSRMIIGARISLTIGFLATLMSLFIGASIGLYAGYYGGRLDSFLSWLITVFWALPTLLLALGLSFFMGKGFVQVLIATGLSTWVEVARVVRGQTLQLKNKEFILASRITGFSTPHILFKHILPNLKGSLTVLATTNFASAILLEAGLGFLGLGVAPPTPSWGLLVKENLGYLVLDQAYLVLIPGAAIMLLVMAFNLMAMGLRDAMDADSE
ncbi:MAG: ABC transporter permease [Bacteroidia bacterium]